MENAPCLGCDKRHMGCHAGCEKYKAFRAKCDAANENRREAGLGHTTTARSHRRWIDYQVKKLKG